MSLTSSLFTVVIVFHLLVADAVPEPTQRKGRSHLRQSRNRDEIRLRQSYEKPIQSEQPAYETEETEDEPEFERQAYDDEEPSERQVYGPNTSQRYGNYLASQRTFSKHSDCEIKYETVSVVKQVPSFTKHCHKVEDTKCKTIFKNAFTTNIETQCTATFDTSCDTTLETAYKQECKIIKDVECRIINLDDSHGGHESKKICEDVPTEKCVSVPVKVEGQQCVNIPVQKCENVPVTASVPVPKQQCFKKPRKVCQTLVSTKPKIVTAQVPREHCGHGASIDDSQKAAPKKTTSLAKTEKMRGFFGQGSQTLEPMTEETKGFTDDYDYSDTTTTNNNNNYGETNKAPNKFVNTEGFDKNLLHFLKQNN